MIAQWKNRAIDEDLVEGLIPNGSLVLFGGEAKQGKSVFLTNLAVAVASNLPWLGRKVSPGPVLWCAYEESVAERAHILAAYEGIESLPIHTAFTWGNPLDDEDGQGLNWLWGKLDETRPRLVIIDPLMGAMQDAEFDKPRQARLKLEGLKKIAEQYGIVIIVIHHLNKSFGKAVQNRLSGSHQLSAASSASWTIRITTKNESWRDFELNYWARIIGSGTLRIRSAGLTYFEDITKSELESAQPTHARKLSAKDALLRLVESEPDRLWTTAEAEIAIRKSTSTVNKCVQELVSEGKLERPTDSGPNSSFRLVARISDHQSESN